MDTTILLNASLFITGFVLGLLLLWLFMRGRIVELEAARKLAEINLASAQAAPAKVGETFQALAAEALRSNQQAFLESARSTLETVRVEMTGDLTQRQTECGGGGAFLFVQYNLKSRNQAQPTRLAKTWMMAE